MSNAATYPARVDARLEQPLSRWLGLVKWLRVIPHANVLVRLSRRLVLVTWWLLALPHSVLGMDRRVLRVAAYVSLMMDKYPPFRLGMGEREPGSP